MKLLKDEWVDRLEKQSKTTSLVLPDIDSIHCNLWLGLAKMSWALWGAHTHLVEWLHSDLHLVRACMNWECFLPSLSIADSMGTARDGNPWSQGTEWASRGACTPRSVDALITGTVCEDIRVKLNVLGHSDVISITWIEKFFLEIKWGSMINKTGILSNIGCKVLHIRRTNSEWETLICKTNSEENLRLQQARISTWAPTVLVLKNIMTFQRNRIVILPMSVRKLEYCLHLNLSTF